jgi:biopolymer transport protein TolR
MLVLLIIFMVTAPLMMGGAKLNLPKTGGTPMPRPDNPAIVSLDAEGLVYLDKDLIGDRERANVFRSLATGSETGEVFVRGDGDLQYAKVLELMGELGQAGFARVTLVTSVQDGPEEGNDGLSENPSPLAAQEEIPIPAKVMGLSDAVPDSSHRDSGRHGERSRRESHDRHAGGHYR